MKPLNRIHIKPLFLLFAFSLISLRLFAQTPTFSAHPSDKTICEASSTTFSVTASNVNTYHWETFNGSTWQRVSNAAPYSGVNTSTLTITNASSTLDGKQYRCFVYSASTQFAISNTATLSIDLLPKVTDNPLNKAIDVTENASFSVTATGTNITYQWQENTGSGWTNLTNTGVYSNVTTSTLNITSATLAMNGNLYRCEVSGKCSPAAQSTSALLNVALPLSINTQPTNSTICEQSNTSFTINASNVNTYTWQVNDGNGWTVVTNTAPYSGATTATLTITNATTALNNNEYRCYIYNPYSQYLVSNDVVLTVNGLPTVTTDPTDAIVSTNANTSFSVATTGTNLTYQWQENTGSGWNNLTNTGVYSNVTTNTLDLTATPVSMDGNLYRCIVSGTCSPNATSQSASLTITTPPSINTHPASTTVCEASNATFTIAGSHINTYHWEENDGSGWSRISNGGLYSGAHTATLTIATVTPSLNNNQYRCVVYNASAQYISSNAATLTINNLPKVTVDPSDKDICLNTNATFAVTATGKSITYQWQEDDGSGWANLSNGGAYSTVTTKTLNIASVTQAMDGNKYRCIVSGACSPNATSKSATLNIDLPPSITTQPVNTTVCENSSTNITVDASGTKPTYQWQVDDGSGFKNISNGSIYSGVKTKTLSVNADASLDGYVYHCVVSGKCSPSETSQAAILTVNLQPDITGQPVNSIICDNGNTNFGITATGTNLTYQWQADDGSGFKDISDNSIFNGATSNTLTLTNVTYSMNGLQFQCIVSGTCSPDVTSAIVDLQVLQTTSVLTNIKADTFCEGAMDNVILSTQGHALTYQWQIDDGTGYKNIIPGAVFTGVTTDILMLNNTPKTLDGQYIRCIVNGTCLSDTIKDVKVNINTKPEVLTAPNNVTTIQGQNATFSITASGTDRVYQWQASTGGTYSNLNDNAIYSGSKTNQLTINSTTEAQDGFTYRCIVIGKQSCLFNNDTSVSAILNVNPPLSINNNAAVNNNITLYPNPVSGNTISVKSSINKDLSFVIVDKMGRTVAMGNIEKSQQASTINIDQLPTGVYLISFIDANTRIQTIRFSKL